MVRLEPSWRSGARRWFDAAAATTLAGVARTHMIITMKMIIPAMDNA